MNWGQLVSEFHLYLGQDEANPTFFSSDDVKTFMQKAMREANVNANMIHKRVSLNLTAGTGTYDLPDDCYEAYRVAYDGYAIDAYSQQRLDAESRKWRDDQGTPYKWYTDRMNKKVGLYPKPDVSSTLTASTSEDGIIVSVGTDEDSIIIDTSTVAHLPLPEDGVTSYELTDNHLEVWYRATPADADDANDPDIPQWAAHYLLFAGLAEAFTVGIPDPDYERASAFRAHAEMLKDRIRLRTANVLPKVWNRGSTMGYRGRSLQSRYPATIGDA
ncbi:MAG: hypothetical protein IPH09_12985 [bacterium]|nr:hypothetical protein [bacterium]